MRAMRVNDLAFFYHSNCKIPGIAGVMRIVEEHQIDESAFDPDHPYYDAKSVRDNPKWELVKVEFVKKFAELVTLKDLKKFAAEGGALEQLQMLKQGRLSVSSVQPKEWRFILELADEPVSLGQPEKADGYEGGTDGETEEPNGIEGEPDGVSTGLEEIGYANGEGESSDVSLKDALGFDGHVTDSGQDMKAEGGEQTASEAS
jgi:predicted RNA-binding protein with PUA-like domain